MKRIGKHRFKSSRKLQAEQNFKANPARGQVDAVLSAGYSESTARARASEILADANAEIQQAFRARGFTGDSVAEGIIYLTNHNNRNIPAPTRLSALITGAKMLGYVEKQEEQTDNRPIQIIFPSNFKDALTKESAGD